MGARRGPARRSSVGLGALPPRVRLDFTAPAVLRSCPCVCFGLGAPFPAPIPRVRGLLALAKKGVIQRLSRHGRYYLDIASRRYSLANIGDFLRSSPRSSPDAIASD